MVKAICTEKKKGFNIKSFTIFEGFTKEKPHLSFSISPECWPEDYDGCGSFTVDLESILAVYLKEFWWENHGERTLKVTSLLREYADRIESSWKQKMARQVLL
jgi:hypothetical protein